MLAAACCLDVSEQILIPNPGFMAFLPTFELINANPKFIELKEEENYAINSDTVRKQIDRNANAGTTRESTGGERFTGPDAPAARAPDSAQAAWGFIAWGPHGGRKGGLLRDTREDCEEARAQDRALHPDWLFSPCVWVRAVRDVL